jgi:pilus assembly protein CpaE
MSDSVNSANATKDEETLQIAPVPRISVQAFCETPTVAQMIDEAIADRRMTKAHVKVHMGGIPAAIEAFRAAPTPNLIVMETISDRASLISNLESLAEFCDAGTKVVIIGHENDIGLYRDLTSRGVSDYIVAPIHVLEFIGHVSRLYSGSANQTLGRIVSIVGAKGGVGASTICHNLAWSISRELKMQTVLADLDLAFGTAGLDFNQDPPQGIAEAVFSPERLDANLVDRLLSKCSDTLSLLAAPATVERAYDLQETMFDGVMDILRATAPAIVLDIPHQWSAWTRRVLVASDDVLIVAGPDLANLRNAKTLIDTLRSARPNDSKAKLVLNGVGVPRRPEISIADFAKAIDAEPIAVIPFEPKLFGTASNNGQMLAEVEQSSKIVETFDELSRALMGKTGLRKPKKNLLAPIIERFSRRKAG